MGNPILKFYLRIEQTDALVEEFLAAGKKSLDIYAERGNARNAIYTEEEDVARVAKLKEAIDTKDLEMISFWECVRNPLYDRYPLQDYYFDDEGIYRRVPSPRYEVHKSYVYERGTHKKSLRLLFCTEDGMYTNLKDALKAIRISNEYKYTTGMKNAVIKFFRENPERGMMMIR